MTVNEQRRQLTESHKKAAILHCQMFQGADQHDAHLTSLLALVLAGKVERHNLFLDESATIMRLYPRILAIGLVSLDDPNRFLSTRKDLPEELTQTI